LKPTSRTQEKLYRLSQRTKKYTDRTHSYEGTAERWVGITIRPIIVTGAAGFIGSTLVETILNKYDIPVIGIDDLSAGKQKNIDRLKRCFGSECFTFRQIDITDRESLEKLFWESKPAVVFHQAASKKNICLKDPHRDLEVNGGGTLNLLELSRQYQVEKFYSCIHRFCLW